MTDKIKIPTFEELMISPSMLKSVAECPLKFWQSYITKTLPFVEAAQKARGTKLHKFLEDSIDSGEAPACQFGQGSNTWHRCCAGFRARD